MTYQETCDYLFSQTNFELQGKSGYKEGLDTMLTLDEHFGHPHQKYRTIHIAGTNGKGSCSHMIAAQLQVCGYRVGLYTSPHLLDFRERIRVNGKPISEEYVTDFIEQEKGFLTPHKPSFFEITTAMAFKYFADMDVDIAVIEVGLGGRLDSTNVITPILSLITNISLDHTQLLGASVEQIAFEKAGIIKPGVPVVIGETLPETRPVFEAIAQEAGSPIIFADDPAVIESCEWMPEGYMQYKTIHGVEFRGELAGVYQEKNTNTVLYVIHELMKMGYLCDCEIEENKIKIEQEMCEAYMNVCKLTGLMGRWQKIQDSPLVICDTGHNTGGWQYLSQQISNTPCHHRHIVFGMVDDKDIYGVMSLLPKDATYYFTKPSSKRAMPEQSVKVFGDQFGLSGESYTTVAEAYKAARAAATNDDFIFVGGSTYVVSDFMKMSI